ncbi:MAG: right-handed parallel beta-helix repeat-containing protein [Anaerolineae bacterium]
MRTGRVLRALVGLVLLLIALPVNAQSGAAVLRVGPGQPYATLDAALQAAAPGDTIEVHGGQYPAPLIVDKSVQLVGVDRPVIDGGGEGSLVLISAPDVRFEGFRVRASGENLGREDTGIVVQAARVTVANNVLEDVLFGIYFANAADGIARGNHVTCKPRDIGVRGDGMRVWYSTNVQILDNVVESCRDTLIWYAEHVVLAGNQFRNNRYGMHSMYSSHALVQGNLFEGNSVGSYLMYSRYATLTGNHFLWNRGPSGYGIAFKEMDEAVVEGNVLVGNRSGLYIDNSPALVDVTNRIAENFIAYNDIGISALPSTLRNEFTGNTFLENLQQISVLGRGDLLGNAWQVDGAGNYWSDYAGYDRDGDGIGDVPYRAERLFESLADREPGLRLFTFSPASQAMDFAAAAFPTLRPDPKVIDTAPQMRYTLPPALAFAPRTRPGAFLVVSLGLVLAGGGVLLAAGLQPRRRRRRLRPVAERQG